MIFKYIHKKMILLFLEDAALITLAYFLSPVIAILIVTLLLLHAGLLSTLYSFFARLIDSGIVLAVRDNSLMSNVGHLMAGLFWRRFII